MKTRLLNILKEQFILVNKYLVDKSGNITNHSKTNLRANLWDFSAFFTQAIKLYKVKAISKNELNKVIDELEWYKSLNRDDEYLVYASENGDEKPVFYDDNVWLALGFIELYELFRDPIYLNKAKAIMEFIYNSWQEQSGGGLLWREFPSDLPLEEWVRNTCINGPAAYASLLIYINTGDRSYLDWGLKIYNWTKKNLRDKNSYTYYDNVNYYGKVDKKKWTYNTGTMLSSAALLYVETNEFDFLNDLNKGLKGVVQDFETRHVDALVLGRFYEDHPWFKVYLFQAFLDIDKYASNNLVEELIDDSILGFLSIYENNLNKEGILLPDWDGRERIINESNEIYSLHTAGNLETIALFLEYLERK